MFIPTMTTLAAAASTFGPFTNSSGQAGLIGRALNTASNVQCTSGTLLCNGPNLFGICGAAGTTIFQAVAPGTVCSCDDGDKCSIAALSSASQAASETVSISMSAPSAPPAAPTQSSEPATSSAATWSYPTPAASTAASTESSSVASAPASSTAAASASSAAPAPASSSGSSASVGKTYTTYQGDGSVSAGWPSMSDWLDFDTLWSGNLKAGVTGSCSGSGAANASPEEIADIKTAILSQAKTSGLDPRFILAIGLDESNLCPRVPTTSYSVSNPGMYQSHAGQGTCANVNPCPASEIDLMVQDGVEGTSSGAGLKQCFANAHGSDAQAYYVAARIYNSGSVAPGGNLGEGVATHCYSSNLANRLVGWTGSGECTLS